MLTNPFFPQLCIDLLQSLVSRFVDAPGHLFQRVSGGVVGFNDLWEDLLCGAEIVEDEASVVGLSRVLAFVDCDYLVWTVMIVLVEHSTATASICCWKSILHKAVVMSDGFFLLSKQQITLLLLMSKVFQILFVFRVAD